MALTPAQNTAILADIAANADMNTQPATNVGCQVIADLYNAASTTDVWRTDAGVTAVADGIDWTKFVPTDGVPAINSLSGNGELQQHSSRVLVAQTKQATLQLMLQARTTIDGSKANIRAGLRDAVTNLPTGSGGALVSAAGTGGVNVLTPLVRKATRAEKLFAISSAVTGAVTANLLVFEGQVTRDDIAFARGV
jgi:hypothetical protein